MGDLWDDIWDGIEDAEIFERGRYVDAGFQGVVEMVRTIGKSTRKSGLAFIVEMKVISSNLPQHPVGQKVTWYQGLRDQDVAFPAIAKWAGACAGFDPNSDKDKIKAEVQPDLKRMLGQATHSPDDNDFIGIKCFLSTSSRTSGKGVVITNYEFAPVADQ